MAWDTIECDIEEQTYKLVEAMKAPKRVLLGKKERAVMDEAYKPRLILGGNPAPTENKMIAYMTQSGMLDLVWTDDETLCRVE